MRLLGTTAASAYRLDVDQLARETLDQQSRMAKGSANWHPCAVRLHPQTRSAVMRHRPADGQPPYWAPTVDGVAPDTFVGLALITDESVPLGYATLEVCEGCMGPTARCRYATQEGCRLDQ
jgi:hypothetical protein